MDKNIVKIDSALRDLIPKFVSHMERDAKTMFDAVQARDVEILIQTSHRLRGDAPGYGFIDFGTICGKIEDHARANNVESCEGLVEQLLTYVKNLEIEYVDT